MSMPRILRVFPRRTSYTPTDEMAFVGQPPLCRPDRSEVDEVHISTAFTWDMPRAAMLRDAWAEQYPGVPVRLGGPAYPDSYGDGSFVSGLYVKPGVTFTSRGCNNHCPWCLVWQREGRLRELPIVAPGNIVQDNALLQCSRGHVDAVFDMLKAQKRKAVFAGGLSPEALWRDEGFCRRLLELRPASIFLAADTDYVTERWLFKAVSVLPGLTRRQLRCYMLCGFRDEEVGYARERLKLAWRAGVMPFAQLYQPPDKYIMYGPEWRALAREWSRPAAMMAMHKEVHP